MTAYMSADSSHPSPWMNAGGNSRVTVGDALRLFNDETSPFEFKSHEVLDVWHETLWP